MPGTPRPSTKPANIANTSQEQRQYSAGATHSFERETLQAQRIWLAAAPGEYGFQNEPVDDHQFGVMIQGFKPFIFGMTDITFGIAALGHSFPTSASTKVAYVLAPTFASSNIDGAQTWLGTGSEPWHEIYANHLNVEPAYVGDAGFVKFDDSSGDPAIDGALQRNGTKLLFNDGSVVVDLTLFDHLSKTQGNIIYANGTTWTVLGPGTSGQFLKTQGAAANPMWDTVTTVSPGSAGYPLDVEIDVAESDGTSAAYAREDHKHALAGITSSRGSALANLTGSFQAITGMSFAVGANENWAIQAFVMWDGDSSTDQIEIDFTEPTGGTVTFVAINADSAFAVTGHTGTATTVGAGASAVSDAIMIFGSYAGGGNAGTVAMRARRVGANAPDVAAGSWILGTKL